MERLAFKMKLRKGYEAEYKRRHDNLWPGLRDLLKSRGINNYSIFLDQQTGDLFAVMDIERPENLNSLPEEQVMKEWWAYMKDLMETNPDDSPVRIDLENVFFLK